MPKPPITIGEAVQNVEVMADSVLRCLGPDAKPFIDRFKSRVFRTISLGSQVCETEDNGEDPRMTKFVALVIREGRNLEYLRMRKDFAFAQENPMTPSLSGRSVSRTKEQLEAEMPN